MGIFMLTVLLMTVVVKADEDTNSTSQNKGSAGQTIIRDFGQHMRHANHKVLEASSTAGTFILNNRFWFTIGIFSLLFLLMILCLYWFTIHDSEYDIVTHFPHLLRPKSPTRHQVNLLLSPDDTKRLLQQQSSSSAHPVAHPQSQVVTPNTGTTVVIPVPDSSDSQSPPATPPHVSHMQTMTSPVKVHASKSRRSLIRVDSNPVPNPVLVTHQRPMAAKIIKIQSPPVAPVTPVTPVIPVAVVEAEAHHAPVEYKAGHMGKKGSKDSKGKKSPVHKQVRTKSRTPQPQVLVREFDAPAAEVLVPVMVATETGERKRQRSKVHVPSKGPIT